MSDSLEKCNEKKIIKVGVTENTLVLINKLERILGKPADSIIADLIKQASQGYGLIEARD